MSEKSNSVYEFGPFRLDPSQGLLVKGTRKVPLTPKAPDVAGIGRKSRPDYHQRRAAAEGVAGCFRRGGHSSSECLHAAQATLR